MRPLHWLEALDLFFNDGKGVIKYDRADINVDNTDNEFVIGVTFEDLPERVIVDATFQTTLADEFLLDKDGKLKVIKKYNGSQCTNVLLKAFHPTNPQCADLHLKKRNELKAIKSHTLTHYIRDVQHHPENEHNPKYTDLELAQSIADMRTFIAFKIR